MKKHDLVDLIPVYEEEGVYNFYLRNQKQKPEEKEEQKKTDNATTPTAMDVSAVGSSASTDAGVSTEAAEGADGWQTVFRRHAGRR